ncbi:glycosyltransferase [Compostibacter hankyongensis]|uniref:Streptomycin biosynthesis protein StrF domain-containing protein n=1 Tax=Compostibacter hankyongensis TaxID=1007089 RepID=A0ABP8FI86_9BACT
MISVIICSIDDGLLQAVSANIGQTIGVPFELVVIRNREKGYSLTKAYNTGAAASRYPFLCFVHEDVRFLTADWGKTVTRHLQEEGAGLVGVAGGCYKSIIPSSWSVFKELRGINIVQGHRFSSREKFTHTEKPDGCSGDYLDVVTVDGVFMASPKAVWEKHPFDEALLQGFHGYDTDFSLQVGQHYRVRVIYDLLLEHFSEGQPGRAWMESALRISYKWRKSLPSSVQTFSPQEERRRHRQARRLFFRKLLRLPFSWGERWRLMLYYSRSIRRLQSDPRPPLTGER